MLYFAWSFVGVVFGFWIGLAISQYRKGEDEEVRDVGGTWITSPEDPAVEYLCFHDISLIFHEGKYRGWYLP